jgi:hypothetical protein
MRIEKYWFFPSLSVNQSQISSSLLWSFFLKNPPSPVQLSKIQQDLGPPPSPGNRSQAVCPKRVVHWLTGIWVENVMQIIQRVLILKRFLALSSLNFSESNIFLVSPLCWHLADTCFACFRLWTALRQPSVWLVFISSYLPQLSVRICNVSAELEFGNVVCV